MLERIPRPAEYLANINATRYNILYHEDRNFWGIYILTLLILIYIAFISLGLPDSLLGSAWPAMHKDIAAPLIFSLPLWKRTEIASIVYLSGMIPLVLPLPPLIGLLSVWTGLSILPYVLLTLGIGAFLLSEKSDIEKRKRHGI
ncbi:MAG: hypothetical protein LBS84_10300 [Clostridiales bacterium]|jgi:hypothetical protein|nr:hypothetical protein [Clostridiales bacterium]